MTSARPSFIPSNPDQVYRKNWQDLFDWLGRDRCRERKANAVMGTAKPLCERAARVEQHARGMNKFKEIVSTFAPHFEIAPMPKQATVDFLFRPKRPELSSSSPTDLFAALHVRTSKSLSKPRFHVLFSQLEGVHQTKCAAITLDFVHDRLYLFPGGTINTKSLHVSVPERASIGPSKYDSFLITDMNAVGSFLEEEYRRGELHGVQDWYRRSVSARRDQTNQEMFGQLSANLYDPCGVSLRFPRDFVVDFNSVLEGGGPSMNVVHRSAYKRDYVNKSCDRHEITMNKIVDSVQVPFDRNDDVDIVIVGVRNSEGKTSGCFLFPKSELVERKYFSVDHRTGGLTKMALYPGWAKRATSSDTGKFWRTIAKIQDWQSDFFVDFSHPDLLAAARHKFQKLYRRVVQEKQDLIS